MIGITLTGADQRTKVDDLVRLADMGAEIGILYTWSPDGRNRYPSLSWIIETAEALCGRSAIHICGQRARAEVIYSYPGSAGIGFALECVRRFQVNGKLSPLNVRTICHSFPDHVVITQDAAYNRVLRDMDCPNHALLVDASGGRGLLPQHWTRPATTKSVGFAGGLGPETLRDELPKIAQAAQGDWWIDMEGRLRDEDDWFDIERARSALTVFQTYLGGKP